LALTAGAAAVVAEERRRRGVPVDYAVRISQGRSDNGRGPTYVLRFSAAPRPDDVVVASATVRLFIAPDVIGPLDDAVLDAEDTGEGRRLVLRPAA
jgi:Fe-S cluster assembly iron-binding protein IscA